MLWAVVMVVLVWLLQLLEHRHIMQVAVVLVLTQDKITILQMKVVQEDLEIAEVTVGDKTILVLQRGKPTEAAVVAGQVTT
jgi:hypothetical protein